MIGHDITPIVDYIIQKNGVIKIKGLEEKFKIGLRTLEKEFIQHIGLSPKEFARVTRFNALFAEIKTDPSVSWSEIIDKYGYYDQSHFIRDFQHFTGQSPTDFLKVRQLD